MRWIKHLTNAHQDQIMAALLDEFGAEGYGIWWIILEKIGQNLSKEDQFGAKYSIRNWCASTNTTQKKFYDVIRFLSENGRIQLEEEGKFLVISCKNILKYRDEYTRKQKTKSPPDTDNERTLSGETPDTIGISPARSQELDYRVQNTDTDTEQIPPPDDPIPYLEIIEFLNETCGTQFKHTTKSTRSWISGRWKDGFRVEDFKTVITSRHSLWSEDKKMSEYLRPSTLFAASHFEEYLNFAKKAGNGSSHDSRKAPAWLPDLPAEAYADD